MTILFLSTEYPPRGGGIASYIAAVAAALARRGHEVHVLSCADGQVGADWRDDDGVHVHQRGTVRLAWLEPLLRSGKARMHLEVSASCFLEQRRLGIRFDVVESPDYVADGFIFALLRSTPLVGHLHTPLLVLARHNGLAANWDRRFGDALERFTMRRADVVTSPSRMLARDLVREGWLGAADARIVRHPIDLSHWSEVPPAEATRPRIVAVGRLEPRKAPETLVEAAAVLAPAVPGLEVVFVGGSNYARDGMPYQKWTEALARKLGSPCCFTGPEKRSAILNWLGSARVSVLPARYDNFPVAGLEAMAAARPLVCTSRTGIAELIEAGGGGTVVPALDATALADALRPYLLDPDLAGRVGRHARVIVARECDPDTIAHEREMCYVDAIEHWQRVRNGRLRRRRRSLPTPL
jgi:glycogen(starch) synthase